jgi:hypothetical protein
MIGANSPDEQPTFSVGFGIKDHPYVAGLDPPERSVLLKRLALGERSASRAFSFSEIASNRSVCGKPPFRWPNALRLLRPTPIARVRGPSDCGFA